MISNLKSLWTGKQFKNIKRRIAIYNNARENRSCITYDYKVEDKVLITLDNREIESKLQNSTEGPFEIKQVYNNGTVKIIRGTYDEIIKIHRIKSCHTQGKH